MNLRLRRSGEDWGPGEFSPPRGVQCVHASRPAPREIREYVAAGLAFNAIGAVGLGVGVLFNGLLVALSINQESRGTLIGVGLLGFALVESALLFAMLAGFSCLYQ